MRRPSSLTLFVGHPSVSTLLGLACWGLMIAWWLSGGDGLGYGIVAIVVALAAARPIREAAAYRAWKREWDALGDPPPPRKGVLTILVELAVFVVLLVVGWAVSQADASTRAAMVGCLVLLAPVLLAVLVGRGLFQRLRRRRRNSAEPVTVVATALLPVPTLAGAYAALPDYCQSLMTPSSGGTPKP